MKKTIKVAMVLLLLLLSNFFIKKHKGIAIGNGLIFTLMLFIPFVGIMITLPISTVASTIDSVKKLHADKFLKL